jgi:iron complex outermembrane receptor protein
MYKKLIFLAASAGTFALPARSDDLSKPLELEPVIITAPLQEKASETAVPVTVLEGEDLTMKMGHSIGETLKQELGITSQSFGPGVGTPVIRGQSGPRVKVLSNGIGSNDVSQLSPDHATSVEPLLAERIEVLRGPATLLYGSGAIGGVVNVIDNRIPGFKPDKLFGGAFEQRYDSVSDETSTALKAEGGKDHLAYHLDGFYRDRNNLNIGGQAIDVNAAQSLDPSLQVIQNSKGVIPNTSAHAINGSAGVSLVGDPGFAGISINRLENNYGIAPDGSGGANVRIDLKQSKYDFKSELKNPFSFAESLRMRLGYTDYQHTELDDGSPGTAFTNKTYEGRMELTHKPIGPFRGVTGFQANASDFAAFNFNGAQTIVPKSQINSYGVFGVESFDYGPVTYQLGGRVEENTIDPLGGSNLSYTPISASASGLWKVNDHNSLNLAFTRSQRAPQVQELLSHGFHDATRSFEQGDINLKPETSYNLDLGYRFKSDWVKAELDLFHNWANDYIFQQRTGQFVFQDDQGNAQPCGSSTNCTPVVQSGQANAIFKGFESKLIFPVMENHYGLVDFTLFSDYTRGQFANGVDVPRMPPLRYGLQVEYSKQRWTTNLRLTRAESQDHPGANDTPTAGYFLLNVGAQYQIEDFHDAKLMLFAKGNNLLNENIRNSTSYLRNFSPEPGRGAEVGIRISY